MCVDYEVDFEPVGKRVEIPAGTTLLDAARLAGVGLTSDCGGQGTCGQCRVIVIEGAVTPPGSSEKSIFTEPELDRGERLACCACVEGNVKVHIPKRSLVMNQRLQISGMEQAVIVDPLIQAYPVAAHAPDLHDLRADSQRIMDALPHGVPHLRFDPAAVRQVSQNARAYDWQMTVYVRGDEVIGVAPPNTRAVGLAVDLGTTKIAACLVDLEHGTELAAVGAMNPQIGYGEDVISRLVFTRRSEGGAHMLAALIRSTLDDMLGDLVKRAGIAREHVADVCIVGNTAMIHLLLHFPVSQLVTAPYVAAVDTALDIKARELDLHTAPGAYVHVLPGIGGFVGADHVAMILGSQLDRTDRVTLGIDIGTNTEIVLTRPGEGFLAAVSCASGPAFEGAHISDGMRAASGAIEAVTLTDSHVQLKTIDDGPPIGLCGSGMVDAIAELRRAHLINTHGRFDRSSSRVRAGKRGLEFLLVSESQSGTGRDIVISQEDINEIQLAKGAIRAGLDVLLETARIHYDDVETVLIAGAFGSYLNIQSALATGLFPRFPNAEYRQIGNAALSGAKWALVSRHERERARHIASKTRYIELTTHPQFKRLFAYGMLIPDEVQTA